MFDAKVEDKTTRHRVTIMGWELGVDGSHWRACGEKDHFLGSLPPPVIHRTQKYVTPDGQMGLRFATKGYFFWRVGKIQEDSGEFGSGPSPI